MSLSCMICLLANGLNSKVSALSLRSCFFLAAAAAGHDYQRDAAEKEDGDDKGYVWIGKGYEEGSLVCHLYHLLLGRKEIQTSTSDPGSPSNIRVLCPARPNFYI